ncbi:MAG: hypothetical protein ABEI77_07610 [Halorientalis sp.]
MLVHLLSGVFGVSSAVVMLGLVAWHGREVLQAGQKAGTVVRALFFVSVLAGVGLALGIVKVDVSRLVQVGTEAMAAVSNLLAVMPA